MALRSILTSSLLLLLEFFVPPAGAQELPPAPGAEVQTLTPKAGFFTEQGSRTTAH